MTLLASLNGSGFHGQALHRTFSPFSPQIPPSSTRSLRFNSRPSATLAEPPLPSSTTAPPPTTPPASWPSAAALSGAFSATQPPQQADVPLPVSGAIPRWLAGSYIRNGPGSYDNGTTEGMVHMFDGYALLLKLEIDGAAGSVAASHRYVESEAYKACRDGGSMKWREFATPVPSEGLLAKAADVAGMALGSLGIGQGVTDNASVNVLSQGGRVWAATETVAGTIEFDPVTLRTLGRTRYADSLYGDLTTAHPTLLPNGDLINLLSAPGIGFTVYRQRCPSSGTTAVQSEDSLPTRERIATVPHLRPLSPAWIHDFPGSTQNIVIPETPLFFNLGALMLGIPTPHIFLDWAPQEGTRMHVVSLRDGAVRTYTAPPFFVFHWANAFESEDGRFLYLDAAVYDDPEIVNHLELKNVRNAQGEAAGPTLPRSTLRRMTIDLHAPSGSPVASSWQPLLADADAFGSFIEFPTANPQNKGRVYSYLWGTCAVRPTNVNNALGKFSLKERSSRVWHEPGSIVGEPTFVPRPGATAEDDGVVIAVITQADGKASLLGLDGQSHSEIFRAVLPHGVTNGFHAAWLPKQA